MKTFLMSSAAAAVLTLGLAAPAAAADCAAVLASLKQQSFTGSVNATDAATAATTSVDQAAAIAPVSAGKEASAATPKETNPDQMAAAPAADQLGTAGMSTEQKAAMDSAAAAQTPPIEGKEPAGTVPGTEATAAMNAATEGIATSPKEVEGQQTAQPAETAPSAEQLAAADEPIAPVTSPTSGGEPVDLRAVMLARAEAYQKLGNEGACMNVAEQAKAIQ